MQYSAGSASRSSFFSFFSRSIKRVTFPRARLFHTRTLLESQKLVNAPPRSAIHRLHHTSGPAHDTTFAIPFNYTSRSFMSFSFQFVIPFFKKSLLFFKLHVYVSFISIHWIFLQKFFTFLQSKILLEEFFFKFCFTCLVRVFCDFIHVQRNK